MFAELEEGGAGGVARVFTVRTGRLHRPPLGEAQLQGVCKAPSEDPPWRPPHPPRPPHLLAPSGLGGLAGAPRGKGQDFGFHLCSAAADTGPEVTAQHASFLGSKRPAAGGPGKGRRWGRGLGASPSVAGPRSPVWDGTEPHQGPLAAAVGKTLLVQPND